MGVPELLKYVARTVPGALGRLPQRKDKLGRTVEAAASSETARKQRLPTLWYDYVIVDATNVVQTIGLESLKAMLCDDADTVAAIGVRGSVIMVCDGIRQRQGSARAGRAHVTAQSSDLAMQKFVQQFIQSEHARVEDLSAGKKRNRDGDAEDEGAAYKPADLRFVGRDHFGEGDFKILNLHRRIAFGSAVPSGKKGADPIPSPDPSTLPTFLFVSEDADLFCGALCGPFPQNVSIGTKLREASADMCILSVEKVLVAVGQAAGCFYTTNAPSTAAPAAAKTTTETATKEAPTAGGAKQETSEEYLRSMLPDGAKSKKTKFDDSDDDEEDATPAPVAAAPVTKAAAAEARKKALADHAEKEANRMAKDLHQACLDFIFIFTMILGNDVLPGAVQGATKVDAAACWQAYCAKKFSDDTDETFSLMSVPSAEVANGTAATKSAGPVDDDDEARMDPKHTVTVHTDFLSTVMSGLHYADPAARPTVTEERRIARAYLRKLASMVFHYATGPLIDTRDDQVDKKGAPSLAALLQVLSSKAERPAEYKAVCDPASSHSMANGATVGMGYGLPVNSNAHPLKYTVKKATGAGTMTKEHSSLPGSANLSAAVVLFSKGSTNSADLEAGEGKLGQPVVLPTLAAAWSRSLVPSILKLKAEADGIAKIAAGEGKKEDATTARFGFDTRRMMPMATPAVASESSVAATTAGSIMSAAAISTNYAVGRTLPSKAEIAAVKAKAKDKTAANKPEAKIPAYIANKQSAAAKTIGNVDGAVAEKKPATLIPQSVVVATPVPAPKAAEKVQPDGDWDAPVVEDPTADLKLKKKRPGAKERKKMKAQFEAYQNQNSK